MIGIIDYGMGNLKSVYNGLDWLGADAEICNNPQRLNEVERIILPGVGAFKDCIRNLREKGFIPELEKAVFENHKPILGICLGMQAMARKSYEGGEFEGLGWFDAEVVRLSPDNPKLKVPQIGWNNINRKQDHPLLADLPDSAEVYFVHSFYMNCKNSADIAATFEYGGEFTAAVARDNIFASQFHPEKSQDHGIRILENFLSWTP